MNSAIATFETATETTILDRLVGIATLTLLVAVGTYIAQAFLVS